MRIQQSRPQLDPDAVCRELDRSHLNGRGAEGTALVKQGDKVALDKPAERFLDVVERLEAVEGRLLIAALSRLALVLPELGEELRHGPRVNPRPHQPAHGFAMLANHHGSQALRSIGLVESPVLLQLPDEKAEDSR